MRVSAIKAQVKNPERVSVFIDDHYSFSLHQNQLINANLKVGKELTQTELEKLKDDSEFGKAYSRALEYIMRRPRSKKEIFDYAWRKKWPIDMRDKIAERLVEKGYLNDLNFAKVWTRHRSLGKPISERKLRLELKQKGITDEDANSAINSDQDFDEIAALKRLISKKQNRYSDEAKLKQYLLRQGFRYDAINAVLKSES